MQYQLLGDTDCPIAVVGLRTGEQIKIESGAMVYQKGVRLEGKMNTEKKGIAGALSAFGRSITSGESFFVTRALGESEDSEIAVAPAIPGKICKLVVDENHQYRLNTGAFLACDNNVSYKMVSQKVSSALFGGTGGLFVMETQGYGDLLVNAFGDLLALEVSEDKPIVIDNLHVVAWDIRLDYQIKAASGMIGFTTGEGLVNEFHGNGTVLIQTRNIKALAEAVNPYIVKSSS